MRRSFEILATTRKNILNTISELTLEQLNTVPNGFNNSIGWNFAHCLVTQQILCYKLSGLSMYFDEKVTEKFMKGSSGKAVLSKVDYDYFIEISMELIEKLENDYNAGVFNNFTQYQSSFNYELKTIEDAITLVASHEALHLGVIMSLKKFV